MSRERKRSKTNSPRAAEKAKSKIVHREKSAKDWRYDGIIEMLRQPEEERFRAAGFSAMATELALFAALTGDPRLDAAMSALMELKLEGPDAWATLSRMHGDPNGDLLARTRLTYAQELHSAGLSKRKAAEMAAEAFWGRRIRWARKAYPQPASERSHIG